MYRLHMVCLGHTLKKDSSLEVYILESPPFLQKLIEEKVGPEERLSWAQHNIDKGFVGEFYFSIWEFFSFYFLHFIVNSESLCSIIWSQLHGSTSSC